MWQLRDSLSYRADAVYWHAHLLKMLHTSGVRRLNENFPQDDNDILRLAASEQNWIFDDLVFNAIAMFDYVGNVVGFTLHGNQRRKLKWDGAQKCARDSEFEIRKAGRARICGSTAGGQILRAHAELVKGLADYRAEIIHYEARTGNGHLKILLGLDKVEHELRVTVAPELAKSVSIPGAAKTDDEITLQEAADWLVAYSTHQARVVLRCLERDLLVEAGQDPSAHATHVEIF